MLKSINSLIMIYPLIKLTDQVSDNTREELGRGQIAGWFLNQCKPASVVSPKVYTLMIS